MEGLISFLPLGVEGGAGTGKGPLPIISTHFLEEEGAGETVLDARPDGGRIARMVHSLYRGEKKEIHLFSAFWHKCAGKEKITAA